MGRLFSLFRLRFIFIELRVFVVDEFEDLDTEDEGFISFEEERVSRIRRVRVVSWLEGLGLGWEVGVGEEWF